VTRDWDCVWPTRRCVQPGHEEEECGHDRDRGACHDCPVEQRLRDLEADGPVLLHELTLLPDGTAKWVDKGRSSD
jgi:hypothetical protein